MLGKATLLEYLLMEQPAIAYSCIAPLVVGFATIGLSIYYLSYRYNLLFVIQPKVDTQGQAYSLALQHLLTGIYIAELALIGLFGLGGATGPVIMIAVLFLVTVIYNALMNRYLEPLEKYLPADLANTQAADNESAPLLAQAEEARGDGDAQSNVQQLAQHARVPSGVVDPLARFLEPNIFASYHAMRAWLREDESGYRDMVEDVPDYSGDQLKKAYVNPALTSSTPLIWLPKDGTGASGNEVRENEKASLKASDQAAWIDGKGRVHWDGQNFQEVPIWKAETRY